MRLIGLDPGLSHTGWGIIDVSGVHIRHVAHGVLDTDRKRTLAARLQQLHEGLVAVIAEFQPDEAAVEETFVNKNPVSTLKLGQARGVILLAPAQAGLPVAEYLPNLVKKSIVGSGHAQKEQVMMMVQTLLPGIGPLKFDAADALAVAICHAHFRQTRDKISLAERAAEQMR